MLPARLRRIAHVLSLFIVLGAVFSVGCKREPASSPDRTGPPTQADSPAKPTPSAKPDSPAKPVPSAKPDSPAKPSPPDSAVAPPGETGDGGAAKSEEAPFRLPVGTVSVNVIQAVQSERLRELSAKMREAVDNDAKWFRQYKAAQAVAGKPLPYHERFGLTEAEYAEFLGAADEVSLEKVGESILDITKREDPESFVLDGGAELAFLSGIEFDLDRREVTTVYGICSDVEIVDAGAQRSMRKLGLWTGFQWVCQDFIPEDAEGWSMRMVLGRLTQSGQGVLYYRAVDTKEGRSVTRDRVILTFELPRD